MTEMQFIVKGVPVPQSRPRFTSGGHAYKSPKSREYENRVRAVAKAEMKGRKPLTGQLLIAAVFRLPIPKSWPKWQKEKAERIDIRPTGKPDTSNLLKAVEDAMNGVIYADDAQIVTTLAAKYYSNNPRAEITVTRLGDSVEEARAKRLAKKRGGK